MTTTSIRSGNAVAAHTVGSTWTDVVTSIGGAANVAGLLKKISGTSSVQVVKGGSSAPDDSSYPGDIILTLGDSVLCETDHIWVRSAAPAVLAFETL